jgi:hypothetical protein
MTQSIAYQTHVAAARAINTAYSVKSEDQGFRWRFFAAPMGQSESPGWTNKT